MLIGFSLSFCVRDILNGDVKEDEVALIYSGTRFQNKKELAKVIDQYSEVYWGVHRRKKASAIVHRLLYASRIVQPRVLGFHPPAISSGHWEDFAVYKAKLTAALTTS